MTLVFEDSGAVVGCECSYCVACRRQAAIPKIFEDLERIHSHLSDAAANPGSRENLLAIIEINRDAIGALLEGK